MPTFSKLAAVLGCICAIPLCSALEIQAANTSPMSSSRERAFLQSFSSESNHYASNHICRPPTVSPYSVTWTVDRTASPLNPDSRWYSLDDSAFTPSRGKTDNTSSGDVIHLQTISLVTASGNSPRDIRRPTSPDKPAGLAQAAMSTGSDALSVPRMPQFLALLCCLVIMAVIAKRRLSWPRLTRLALDTRPSFADATRSRPSKRAGLVQSDQDATHRSIAQPSYSVLQRTPDR